MASEAETRPFPLEELDVFCLGAGILGCGGGGEAAWGRALVGEVAGQGHALRLVDLGALRDEAPIFILSAVGGGVTESERQRYGRGLEGLSATTLYLEPAVAAISSLGGFLGQAPAALLCSEIGAGNMLLPLAAAAVVGLPVIDGDACGRAKPEIAISTTRLAGIAAAPLALAMPFGDLVLVARARDDGRAEALARQAAVSAGGLALVARCPAPAARFRDGCIQGSFGRCLTVGRAVAAAAGDAARIEGAIRETVEGARVLARGSVATWAIEARGGFMEGTLEVAGGGGRLRLWLRNEFLLAFAGERLVASAPDLLMVVDVAAGRGLSNWTENPGAAVGREVVVFQAPAHPLWRCAKGHEIFGPRHFGWDLDPVLP